MTEAPEGPTPPPPSGSGAGAAIAAAVLVILAAVGGGLAFGRIARPAAPTPIHVSVTASPTTTPSPTPFDDTSLFKQPLSAGCATAQSVWIVTNGGGLLRYDGVAWEQADDTLRSLTNVSCTPTQAFAVGRVGALLGMDERTHQIRGIDVAIEDLYGVSPLGDGALMVGTNGTVVILAAGQVQPYAKGIEEDLFDVVAFSQTSAWAVGAGGITYRLDQRGWSAVPSGQTGTLRALAATTPAIAVAVGDGGAVVRFEAGWHAVKSGVTANLRDVIVDPSLWIVGEGGTLLHGPFDDLRPIDLHTTCDLVSVFGRAGGSEVWVVGVSGGAGGVWRLTSDGSVTKHWGGC